MFLNDSKSILAKISALIAGHSSTEPISVAVAFWGRGAEVLLQSTTVRFRIICNLQAGGTNPHVIRRLKGIGNVEIRQIDILHAKVIAADGGAIVSSANFSANGLGIEGACASTWLEAGVFVPPVSPMLQEIKNWLDQCWGKSQPILEPDLVAAENAWGKRFPQEQHNYPTPDEDAAIRHISAVEAAQLVSTFDMRTIHFEGRPRPSQLHLRSAAAIIALSGQDGKPMPYSTFVFLFSGGRTRRAFENHRDKFRIHDQGESVSLTPEFVGYFVGADGTMESCTDKKRRKSVTPELLEKTAAWMQGRGPRPALLEGSEVPSTVFLSN